MPGKQWFCCRCVSGKACISVWSVANIFSVFVCCHIFHFMRSKSLTLFCGLLASAAVLLHYCNSTDVCFATDISKSSWLLSSHSTWLFNPLLFQAEALGWSACVVRETNAIFFYLLHLWYQQILECTCLCKPCCYQPLPLPLVLVGPLFMPQPESAIMVMQRLTRFTDQTLISPLQTPIVAPCTVIWSYNNVQHNLVTK